MSASTPAKANLYTPRGGESVSAPPLLTTGIFADGTSGQDDIFEIAFAIMDQTMYKIAAARAKLVICRNRLPAVRREK
jgi:hypothetical protein